MSDLTVVQNSAGVSGYSNSFIHLFSKYLLSTYYIPGIILESGILQWVKFLKSCGVHKAYILSTENRQN